MNFALLKHFKFKSFSYYVIASVITTAIGLIINPFLSLGLSHEDFAVIGYYASFATILNPILSFSLSNFYARNYFLVDDDQRKIMLQTLLSLFLVFGLAIFTVFFVGYYFYHSYFVFSIPFAPFALLSFLPIYFSSFYNIYLLNLRMQNRAKQYAFVTILNTAVGAVLSVLLVYIYKFGAEGRLVAILVVAMSFGFYSLKAEKYRFRIDKRIVHEAAAFCFPLTISAILTFLFMGIDRTFLAQLNDNHSLGLYNIALQISGYLAIFGTILFQALGPDLYRYTSTNQHRKVFYTIILLTALPIIPNLVFMLLSKPLINILTSGKYVEAAGFANILCLKNISYCFAFSLSDTLVGYGYVRYELFNKALGGALALILYDFLIDYFGFYGAAWGQMLSWLVMGLISVLCLVYLRNKTMLKYG